MPHALVVLAAVSIALTACGTTVPMTTSVTALGSGPLGGQPGGSLPAGAPSEGAAAGAGPAGAAGLAGAGAGVGAGAGTTAAPAKAGAATTQPAASSPAVVTIAPTGRGWDKDFVYVGITTQKDVQAVADNAGAKGLDGGDQEGEALAVVAELNRRGGVFGRKIKIIFKDEGTVATAQDPNTVGNATCTYFTQDHPVVALISPVTLMDVPSFRACMAKGKVPLFSASVAAVDKQVGDALAPYFYQSVAPTWDALAPALIGRLKAMGWFGGWNPSTGAAAPTKPKVGVLTPSDDIGKRIGATVKKTLAAAGYTDTVVYEYADPTNMTSAVLQFSGNGVTHVIVTNADLLPFQISANNQGYRPRYGITSYNAPQTFLEGNSPQGQNNGAMGVGWSPSFDVSDANDPGPTGPGETECLAMQAKGGQTFSGKRLAEAVAFAFCDGLRLIVDAATAGGGLLGQQIYAGAQKLATRFSPAFTFANGLGPGRLYIPGAGRDIVWDTGCSCIKYPNRANVSFVG
jgi:hypothetical protein